MRQYSSCCDEDGLLRTAQVHLRSCFQTSTKRRDRSQGTAACPVPSLTLPLLQVINSEVARMQEDGWHVRLRHLSKDCRAILSRAGDMVELDVLPDDPRYGLLQDYDAIVRNQGRVNRVGNKLRAPSSQWPRAQPM
jgi:hypothetical protein